MIKIIEHNDYNKPVDNDTIIEIVDSGKIIKLFKVFDGIWLNPDPQEIKDCQSTSRVFVIPPYHKDYCKTDKQKSKYLEQMTILFKKINSIPLGQSLLEELYKGSPINFSKCHSNVWDSSNMVIRKVKDRIIDRKFRATCIIKPNTEYLENSAMTQSGFQPGKINTIKLIINFNPDFIYSFRTNNVVNYIQPDIILYHELLHIIHSTYNILGEKYLDEEFITFGYIDSLKYLDPKLEYYKRTRDTLLENLNLIKIHVNAIQDPIDKKFFQEKYNLTKNSVIDNVFVDNYIKKYQSILSEYNYVQQLNIKGKQRTSYKEKLFLGFKFDIADPNVYTINEGLISFNNTIEEIIDNPVNILTNMKYKEVNSFLRKEANHKSN